LTPLEAMALAVLVEHPEYHAVLDDRERYLDRDWKAEGGETNPFLHLQMHLAIEEQVSIDQPPGIRDAGHRARAPTRLRARRAPRRDGLPRGDDLERAAPRRAVRQRAYLDC
jgi:hypothetical protein